MLKRDEIHLIKHPQIKSLIYYLWLLGEEVPRRAIKDSENLTKEDLAMIDKLLDSRQI